MHSSTDMQNNNTWIKKTGTLISRKNQQTEQSQWENCNDQNHIPYRNRFNVLEVENHESDDMFEDETRRLVGVHLGYMLLVSGEWPMGNYCVMQIIWDAASINIL